MDLYSRLVTFLKVLLPLAALALLSTVFLLSRGTNTDLTIPFAEEEMTDRMQKQQVTAPFFSGTTPSGDELMFTADSATPARPDAPAQATDLRARIVFADGGRITLTSNEGSFALGSDKVTFAGEVEIESSTGYRIETELLNAAISGIEAEAPGDVKGFGPIGEFTAGRMRITAKNEGGPIHLRFNEGVKLIYDPQKPEEE